MFCKSNKSLFLSVLTILASITIYNIYGASNAFAATASMSTTGSVSIDVSASGNSANIGTDTLTVNTTCSTGYTVTIQSSIDDTTLYKDGDNTNASPSSKIIPTMGTNSNPLPIIGEDGSGNSYLGTWGYSMTNNLATGTFIGLTSTPTIIKQSTTASATGGDQFPVYFGVSVTPTLEPGSYTMAKDNNNNPGTIVYQLTVPVSCQQYTVEFNGNGGTTTNNETTYTQTINEDIATALTANAFTLTNATFGGWTTNPDGTGDHYTDEEVVTNLTGGGQTITLYAKWKKTLQSITNMQEMTSDICYATTVGTTATLRDISDNSTYSVAKLADNKCWMTQNMRLDFSKLVENISADNTNNPSSAFITTANTKPAANNGTWCTTDSSACDDQLQYNTVNIGNSTYDNYGVYYNWYTATAGNGTYSMSTQNTSTTGDICPKGWHLPTGGTATDTNFKVLNNAINSGSISSPSGLMAAPANFVYSGYVGVSSVSYRGSYGYYWSSTADSSMYAYGVRLLSTDVYPGTGGASKYNGFSVRCVADPPNLKSITTMQEMNYEICDNTAINTTAALKDIRDNSTYSVAKLKDGRCWMTQNMRLDFSKLVENISADNTNNPSSAFITAANAKPSANNGTWCTTNSAACDDQLQYNTSNIGDSSYDNYGIYYNWYTATAGNGTYSMSSDNTTGDICPKGWHLPTGRTAASDFDDLNDAINSGSTSSPSGLRASPANFLYSGYVYSSAVSGRDIYGYYWSSTASGSSNAYDLYFNSTDVYPGTGAGSKYIGRSVRCVR